MTRPKQCRSVEFPPGAKGFRPFGGSCGRNREIAILQIDEYEALRLIDYNGLSQESAAKLMQISRPTLTRIYDSARKAVAKAIVENRILQIGNGDVEYYGGWHSSINTNKNNKEMKKIAIPTTNGKLFLHFGKASQFTFVTIDNEKVVTTETIDAPEHAHGVAPRFVIAHGATDVIAGGIGAMPVNMLMEAGIEVHIGAPALSIEDIVAKYIDGTPTFDTNNTCNHQHQECHHHGEGNCKNHEA